MKKIIVLVMMLLLCSCQTVEIEEKKNQISKETVHHYKLVEINNEIVADEITYSECREYKNGLVVEDYTISPIGEKHNVGIYEYDDQLIKSIVRHDGILKYETRYSNKGDMKTSISNYFNDELKRKTIYVYDGNDTVIKEYDGENELISESKTTVNGSNKYVEYTQYLEGVTATMEIELDENDNPIKSKFTQGDIVSVSETTYDEYGNEIHISNPEIEVRKEYIYDEKGEYIEMKTYLNDVLTSYQTREIEYEK